MTIKSRAFDDSGNLQTPGPGVTVSVAASQQPTIWPSSAAPSIVDQGPDKPVALGVKFYSEVGGTIKGIRFYKSLANTGTHVGNLWSSTGTLLATTTFTNETASGWQQANFTTPVPINSSTIYVASYHANTGHYSYNANYFSTNRDNSPLHAPLSGGSWGGNGVYAYGGSSSFPNQTFNANNYWVDVMLQAGPVDPGPLSITTSSLPNAVLNTAYSATLAGSGGALPYSWTIASGSLPTGLNLSGSGVISGTPTVAGLYNFTVRLRDSSNPVQTVTRALSITVASAAPVTIWSSSTVPGLVDSGPDSAVQLGVKFRSDVAGTIRGIRFYKAAANTGTHVASLGRARARGWLQPTSRMRQRQGGSK